MAMGVFTTKKFFLVISRGDTYVNYVNTKGDTPVLSILQNQQKTQNF